MIIAVGRLLDWIRRAAPAEPRPDDLVTLSLGTDIYRAHLVADACTAQGFKVSLLTSEMGAHPHTPGVEQLLLVRAADVDEVTAIVNVHENGS